MENRELSAVQLTRMLRDWKNGDSAALDLLTPIVYAELHRLARYRMLAERPGHVLQPSALVNEAFLRLMNGTHGEWRDRTHFFAFSSRLMRQILVDFARNQNAVRRGQRAPHLDLAAAAELRVEPQFDNLVDLDAALEELSQLDERQARVVELRYFDGLENSEVAEVLDVSEDTVMRDWRCARAWLFGRLQSN
ncbi:MAG: ECF-type sigma factor [Bryobacteraceae bacterium]|jgi:RNA polymerase sigma factor (TIGR02999 family)